MRIDKYLKISRMVKRRTVAQEMILAGIVRLNGRPVKPSSVVRVGDVIEIAFPRRILKVEVICDDEVMVKKGKEAYAILDERSVSLDDSTI